MTPERASSAEGTADVLKAALVAASAIGSTVLNAILGFAELGNRLHPGERYLCITVCASAFALVVIYWALTPPSRVRERVAIQLLLMVTIIAVTIIWFSATYHNITAERQGATYILHGARTSVNLAITATTTPPATIAIETYALDPGNELPPSPDALQEVNDTLVLTGFTRPQTLTIHYTVNPATAPITFVPGGDAASLIWMTSVYALRLRTLLLGGFVWLLLVATLHWCSRSSYFTPQAPPSAGFRPPPSTPTQDESPRQAPTTASPRK
ncbi:MAG TPA: hypothetical protein VN380_05625 [Thermoanaerobaculia bacterium]|nr:hypothetical protein [Thermoanaerobaculia bacterium]